MDYHVQICTPKTIKRASLNLKRVPGEIFDRRIWDVYYYVILGGPIGIINSIENQSLGNVSYTFALYSYATLVISTASLGLMAFFIIRGALKMVDDQRVTLGQTVTPRVSIVNPNSEEGSQLE